MSNFSKKPPDTPPSSPKNIDCDEDKRVISTPPTSPIDNKLKLLESNFVERIFGRLSIFSFKSINEPTEPIDKLKPVLKPLAVYSEEKHKKQITPPYTPPPSPTALCPSPTPSIPLKYLFFLVIQHILFFLNNANSKN